MPHQVAPGGLLWTGARAHVAVALFVLLLAACAGGDSRTPTPADLYLPPPPAQPRFQFEADLRVEKSLQPSDPFDGLRAIANAPPNRPGGVIFGQPTDVAAHGGRVYVTDVATGGVHVFDVPRRKLFRLGVRPPTPATRPLSIDVDGRGYVYVVDAAENGVLVYDSLGLFLRRIGGDMLHSPVSLAIDGVSQQIYVVDAGGGRDAPHRIVVFDEEGRHLRDIGERGVAPGAFNYPADVAVAADGSLYVLDAGNFRIQAFDAAGRYQRQWGRAGVSLGQFAKPRRIAVDASGRLYVSDAAFGTVQVFDAQGEPLFVLGRYSEEDEPGRFGLVGGVDVDETGRLYVLDQFFRKLEVYRPLSEREKAKLAAAAGH